MFFFLVGLMFAIAGPTAALPDSGYIGRVDTIGGTTYDWWFNGPELRTCANAPAHGIHAAWMRSQDQSGTSFPDRNIAYNYYDYATRSWGWHDTDFMQSGLNVFSERSGYGNLDADPVTEVAVICSHGGAPLHPAVARDIEPGAGIFEGASPGSDGFQWPALSVGENRAIHVFAATPTYSLSYTRIVNWPPFDTVQGGFVPDPGFPTHNIAASKVSDRVCAVWVDQTQFPEVAYFSISEDGGTTWPPYPTQMPAPPAFGGDTLTSFYISGLFPFFDWEDRLHMMAAVLPIVNDTAYTSPAAIWHWCEANTPEWTQVYRCGAWRSIVPPCGYTRLCVNRPSIGEDTRGRLYVAWEQLDSANVEPLTGLERSEVNIASSADNGVTWGPDVQVTGANRNSHCYPCILDHVTQDTVGVMYLMDSVAGPGVQMQGPLTRNPVIYQFIVTGLVSAAEPGAAHRVPQAPLVWPSPASRTLHVAGDEGVALLDASGRKVMELQPGANDASRFSSGVYFVRAVSRELSAAGCQKVVIQR